jgi:hypothetical protein
MPTTKRRLIIWGLAIAGVVAIAGAAGVLVHLARGFMRAAEPEPPRITQQLVVERLQTVAKLVASEMTLRDVVIYEHTRYASTKRALLAVTGKVSAGLDLSRNTDVAIDSVAKRITLTLPPAQIISVDVLNVVTYDESAGLLNPFRAEDRDVIQRRVRSQLMTAARQSGILAHADESAAKMLTELLSRDGYVVEIRRPPVQVQPTG